ncbi:type II toxin-antitoxin system ParD family antitoxin [Beijerinckia sp. L45]|uniref:ribbon-helix-helix domain-containing protein n=1 Tax=Beijerinckia sp. L45 TaxID=1641855 RepID=UPI00131B4352|nr:type II toxin-antitoxin system ParD family antitoxin [Beijerinckia sp. L45]
MNAATLSIELPSDLVQLVRSHVESGAYASDSAVIRDALHLLQQRDQERAERLALVRGQIAEAAESADRLTNDQIGRHFDARLAAAEAKRAS